MTGNRARWWRGTHGEWLVAAQVALMALVFFGPRSVGGLGSSPWPAAPVWRVTGVALVMSGLALLLAGGIGLGPGLTPLPYPKDGARLVESGPFALVRHPMYSGGVFIAFGWAFFASSWLTVAYSLLLFVFLDVKSRGEERWLEEKFPGYRGYKRRVARFIPFVY